MMHFRKSAAIAAIAAFAITNGFTQTRSRLTPEALLESKRFYVDAARQYAARPQVPDNVLKAGINFYRAGRPDLALTHLRKADSLGLLKSPDDRFAYFQCLKVAKRYREADAFISSAAKSDSLALMNAGRMDYYEKLMAFTGSRLENPALNSSYSEFGPVLYNDVLYFNSTRPVPSNKDVHRLNMQPYYNLYGVSASNLSEPVFQPKGSFGVAEEQVSVNGRAVGVLPAGINQQYHDGPVFVTPSGNHLFFTSNWEGQKRHHNNARVRLNIYHSVREGRQWGLPQGLPYNDKKWSTQHAVFDEQTSTVYFSSNRPGGRGAFDIWSARLENGKWSEPENLGPNVNTAANEVFPMLTPDGGLTFSSNGWPGLGGLDVFLSDDPSRPSVNLLAGINSEADDFQLHFTAAGNGFLVSNRMGGKGDDDLWSFASNLNEIRIANGVPVPVNIALRYKGSRTPAGADLEIREKERTRLLDVALAEGLTKAMAEAGSTITARAAGFQDAASVLSPAQAGAGRVDLTMEPAVVGPSATGMSQPNGSVSGANAGGSGAFMAGFENRSFEGFQCDLNGGAALISNANDGDQNVTLSDGQRLQTTDGSYGYGTAGTSARAADAHSTQAISMLSDGSGNPAYTLEVSPDGSAREGWAITSAGQVIASGKNVPVRVGEWYDMKMTVRQDSVIASVNGQRLGGGVNPDSAQGFRSVAVSSAGTSQFDDLSYRPLGRTPQVPPGDLALLPADQGSSVIAEAIRSGDASGKSAAVMVASADAQVLAAGLEQIRREQPGYVSSLKSADGYSVRPVVGNSKFDEGSPFDYQGVNYLSTNRPTAGSGKSQTGQDNRDAFRLASFSADGKPVWAAGAFGVVGALASGMATALPSGVSGNSYPGPVTVSSGGNWMVLSDGEGNLLVSKKENGVWGSPAAFAHNSSSFNGKDGDSRSEGTNREGYFDEQTSTLYYSSNRPGGFGGFDIWKSIWDGKEWSTPVNAGPMVNSGKDDISPSVSDGRLIFSSNGWTGLGGQDVFVWQNGMIAPANMMRGVNSAADDQSAWIGTDGKGYVSSNRAGGKGKLDVYAFQSDLSGAIARHDKLGAGQAGASGTSTDQVASSGSAAGASTANEILYGSIVGELQGLSESGEFLDVEIADAAGSPVGQSYRIVNGKLVTTRNVNRRDPALRKVTVRGRDARGKVITKVVEVWPDAEEKASDVFVTLYFASGKIGYRKRSFGDANKVIRMLRSDLSSQFTIDVFTDCVGSAEGNQRVSEKRAKWLLDYMEYRVPGSRTRLKASGRGESNPAVDCGCDAGAASPKCTRQQNDRNRRAEIRKVN